MYRAKTWLDHQFNGLVAANGLRAALTVARRAAVRLVVSGTRLATPTASVVPSLYFRDIVVCGEELRSAASRVSQLGDSNIKTKETHSRQRGFPGHFFQGSDRTTAAALWIWIAFSKGYMVHRRHTTVNIFVIEVLRRQ